VVVFAQVAVALGEQPQPLYVLRLHDPSFTYGVSSTMVTVHWTAKAVVLEEPGPL
jgi:hypothetical protein